jgi:hypothetical protein
MGAAADRSAIHAFQEFSATPRGPEGRKQLRDAVNCLCLFAPHVARAHVISFRIICLCPVKDTPITRKNWTNVNTKPFHVCRSIRQPVPIRYR